VIELPVYKVPTVGSGTQDDPMKPKYKFKINVDKKTGKVDPILTYVVTEGYVLVDSSKPIKSLESKEDVEIVE